jgi:RNA polymerase sigma factor (sigma-70 family)
MDAERLHLVVDHLRRLVPPGGGELTDRQLLDRYVAGRDEAAFAALVRRHGPMVYGLARRALRDAHTAEDVLQATFLILAHKAHTIRRRESINSWLYGVAHRLAARARGRGRRWDVDARRGAAMSQEKPEAVLTQRELETVLDEELKELGDRYRAPLLLCYLEGLTQDEAAERLGWSKGTLRRRLADGRERLRARLLRRGVTLSLGLLTAALATRADAALPLVRRAAAVAVRAAGGAAEGVPPGAAALAEWGMKTMGTTRKLFALWLAVSLLAAGGAAAAHALTRPQPAAAPAAVAVERARDEPVPDDAGKEKRATLGAVWSVAYSPDGRTLATGSGSASDPGALALWDVPTGKVRVWLEQPLGVRAVAFSPDGTLVAAAGWDKVVRVYEVRTGKLRHLLKGHTGPVNGLAFSPDGKVLASASLDKSVRLWGVEKGGELQQLAGHSDWAMSVAFFPDGKSLVSAGKDGTVNVWDVETGKVRTSMKQPGVPIEGVAVSPDGKLIASGGWDHNVRLWDAEKGEAQAMLKGHSLGVLFVTFSPDGKTLASVSGNFNKAVGGETKLWSVPGGEERATFKGHDNSIWSARFSPDGRTLVTGGRDQKAKVWEVATGLERRTLEDGRDTFDPKRVEKVTDKDLDEAWKALAGSNGPQVQWALGRLVLAPEQSVPWLAGRLKPEPKDDGGQEKRVRELIAQLDDDDFDTREKATTELAKLGGAAAAGMRKALDGTPSAEMRQRLNALLEKLGKSTASPEQVRGVRVVEALELMNTAESRKLLQKLAGGAPDAPLTREAAASSRRLDKRP